MISIHTNLSSLTTQNTLNKTTNKLNQAIERMSTGYKINHAGDNAANYSITNDMTAKIGSYEIAEQNTAMGLDLVATASGALDEIQDRLARLRALTEQASNGTYGEDSIDAIKAEAKALTEEIERIYNNTEYNGKKLFGEYTNRGFMDEIEVVTPDVVVTNAADLADAISNNTIIGIDNADVLHELALLVNSGTSCEGKTIILTDDIDLSDYQEGEGWTPIGNSWSKLFKGNFDGQGHVVTNLKTNKTSMFSALFGIAKNAKIKNVAVIDCDICCSANYASGIIGYADEVKEISNCYVTGNIIGQSRTGGIVGADISSNAVLFDCYSSAYVKGTEYVGGICGLQNSSLTISNCYNYGSVNGNESVGGILGRNWGTVIINDCISTGNINGKIAVSGILSKSAESATITNSFSYGIVKKNGVIFTDEYTADPSESPLRKEQISLQVGVYSDEASQIKIETEFDISEIVGLASAIKNPTTLDKIDSLMNKISNKQTELGAAQNRLESALDSIQTSYDNLVSSRSTLRDADMGKVSSEFVRYQILQQAAATLMSTANQSPSIALQLL